MENSAAVGVRMKKAQVFASAAQSGASARPRLRGYCRPVSAGVLTMNVVLYLSVVLIWGTTWLAIFLQQDAATTPVYVAVFWRFLFASLLMLALLTLCRRLALFWPASAAAPGACRAARYGRYRRALLERYSRGAPLAAAVMGRGPECAGHLWLFAG